MSGGGSSFIIEEWRDLWTYKGDFIMVALAYVFSPTNFLRLPQLMHRHAGGAFAVAYMASLLFCCLPLIMMELAIGQLSARAPPQALHAACPLFKGVGVALILYTILFMSTFAVQISHLLNFLTQLFLRVHHDPPWMQCGQHWNSDYEEQGGLERVGGGTGNEFVGDSDFQARTQPRCVSLRNFTPVSDVSPIRQSSLEEFYETYILNKSQGISEPGEFQWMLLSGLAVTWFLVFLAIFLGVRWLGKIAYITFFIPLLLMLALLVKALSAAGGEAMIKSLFNTTWDQLLSQELWEDAFTQSLYATGLCFGAYITLGSYNKRDNNLVGDSFLIVFVHLVLSLLQLITAGGLLGHFFHDTTHNFNSKAFHRDDTSLLVTLATAAFYELPQVWSALLLFFLIFVSLNTLYVLAFNVQAALEDALGDKASRCLPRFGIAFVTCCLGFAVGMGYTLQSGIYGMALVRSFLDLLTPWVLLVFEIMAIAWFYCAHLLARDVSHMLGRSPCWLCSYTILEILYVVAAVPVYILVRKLGRYSFTKLYTLDEHEVAAEAQWPEAIGWIVALLPILPIPLFMIYIVAKTCIQGPGITYWEKFKHTLISPLRYEVVKPMPAPRYSSNAPGYVLLPQAPLAEPEPFNEMYHNERAVRVSNI